MKLTLFVGLICLLVWVPGHASAPLRPPQLDDDPHIPSAGYRRTVEKLFRARRAAEKGKGGAGAPASQRAISGTRTIPVLMVTFADSATGDITPMGPFPKEAYERLLFSDPAVLPVRPTLTQYYWDASGTKLRVHGTVEDWYPLAKPVSHYLRVDDTDGDGEGDLYSGQSELLQTVFARADAELDFGQFDNDGPDRVANSGDDDGKVDTVFIIHSQSGAECVNDPSAGIWSHSWNYSAPALGNGQPFQTRAIRRDKAGQPVMEGGVEQHIVIDDYTIQPGLACSKDGKARIVDIGVFCHEYGHALGIPDLYDRTPFNTADSLGLGNHCLMSAGSWGVDGKTPAEPVGLSAWPRYYLGWAPVTELTTSGPVLIEPAAARGVAFRYTVPGTNGREYFLIEHRSSTWRDPSNHRINWDRGLGTSGLAIWHVDERVGEQAATWPFTDYDAGQNDSASLPAVQGGAFRPQHSLVALIQADAELDLENNREPFETADLWGTGAKFGDDPMLRSGSRAYSGASTGWGFDSIDLTTGTVIAKFEPVLATALLAAGATSTRPAATMSPATGAVASAPVVEPSEERTLSVESKPLTTNGERVRKALSALQKQAGGETPIPEFDESGRFAERITLRWKGEGDKQKDAEIKLKTLRDAVGDVDVAFRDSTKTLHGDSVVFEQRVKVGGESLPVFGSEVAFHYKASELTSVTSSIVLPQNLRVSGANDRLTTAAVKKVAANLVGVPESRIGNVREGLYVGDEGSPFARVAYRVELKAGPGVEPIELFIDEATGELLATR